MKQINERGDFIGEFKNTHIYVRAYSNRIIMVDSISTLGEQSHLGAWEWKLEDGEIRTKIVPDLFNSEWHPIAPINIGNNFSNFLVKMDKIIEDMNVFIDALSEDF